MTKRGFLLFEVMVAVSIVGIAMATILQTISSSLTASRMAGDYFIAGTLLSEKLWEINSRGNAVPGATEGTFKEDARYHYKIAVEELFAEISSPASSDGNTSGLSAVFQEKSLAKITITISWEHRQKSKSLTAQTYLPIQEEQMLLKQINYLQ